MRIDPVYIGTPRPSLEAGQHLSVDSGSVRLLHHGTRPPALFQIPNLSFSNSSPVLQLCISIALPSFEGEIAWGLGEDQPSVHQHT